MPAPRLRAIAVALLLLAHLVSTASAQRPQTRDGFWFMGGLATASLGCNDCGDRVSGTGAAIALGGTVSRTVQLGATINNWYKSEDGATLNVGILGANIRLYPSPTGGFYFNGALGIASIDAEIAGIGSGSETGTGLLLGVGYDIRVGRMLSLTPLANFVATRYDGGDLNFWQLGLAISVH